MSQFGRAATDLSPRSMALPWLAGLLEAEGSFLRPSLSAPNAPIVVCRMTDFDVIERVAGHFGVRTLAIAKGAHRTEYSARLKGMTGVRLMHELRPFMGVRRAEAIDRAVAASQPPDRRLSYELSEQIRASRSAGATVSALARRHEVSRPTIRAVLQRKIYRAPSLRPWLRPQPPLGPGWNGLTASAPELYWLAGWLEGEGSFLAPPPSDPRRPRIAGQCSDPDVIGEVARLFGVSPIRRQGSRGVAKGWSVLFEALLRGARARSFMQALRPVLGSRRQAQIDRALRPARENAPLDSDEVRGRISFDVERVVSM